MRWQPDKGADKCLIKSNRTSDHEAADAFQPPYRFYHEAPT
jgi:hypothetical protein